MAGPVVLDEAGNVVPSETLVEMGIDTVAPNLDDSVMSDPEGGGEVMDDSVAADPDDGGEVMDDSVAADPDDGGEVTGDVPNVGISHDDLVAPGLELPNLELPDLELPTIQMPDTVLPDLDLPVFPAINPDDGALVKPVLMDDGFDEMVLAESSDMFQASQEPSGLFQATQEPTPFFTGESVAATDVLGTSGLGDEMHEGVIEPIAITPSIAIGEQDLLIGEEPPVLELETLEFEPIAEPVFEPVEVVDFEMEPADDVADFVEEAAPEMLDDATDTVAGIADDIGL